MLLRVKIQLVPPPGDFWSEEGVSIGVTPQVLSKTLPPVVRSRVQASGLSRRGSHHTLRKELTRLERNVGRNGGESREGMLSYLSSSSLGRSRGGGVEFQNSLWTWRL